MPLQRRRPLLSPNINDPNLFLVANVFGEFNDPTIDTSGYGSLPSVAQTQTYFAYYNGYGRMNPEIPKNTTFFIKYLIDTNGNIVKPQPDDISVINMVDNFEVGKPVFITTKTPTTQLNVLLGEKTVTHVGELSTLLVSNTGSGKLDYVTTMSFQNTLGISLAQTASDYNMTVRANTGSSVIPVPNEPITLSYPGVAITASTNIGQYLNFNIVDNAQDPLASTFYAATGEYTFQTNTNPEGNSRVKFRLRLNIINYSYKFVWLTSDYTDLNQNFNENNTQEIVIKIRVVKNGTDTIYSKLITPNNLSYNQYFTIETPFFNFLDNDVITFWADPLTTWEDQLTNNNVFTLADLQKTAVFLTNQQGGTSRIQAINENQNITGLIDGATGCLAPYFTIGEYPDQNGSSSAVYTQTSVITASQGLSNMYREGTVQTLSPKLISASYSTPWQPIYQFQPGDYIIFEQNKNNVHVITEIIPSITSSNNSSSFGLRVVPGIPTGSIIDNFCIYRILNNGSQIMIDQEGPSLSSAIPFKGFIRPKYISKELEDNFTNIINKLEADGLLND